MSVNRILAKLSLEESQQLISGAKNTVKTVSEQRKKYTRLKSTAAEEAKITKASIESYDDMLQRLKRAYNEAQDLKALLAKGDISTADVDKKIREIQSSEKILQKTISELQELVRLYERI